MFYKELNNLLLSVTSVCPRPGQKKKLPTVFVFFNLGDSSHLSLVFWTKMKNLFGPELKRHKELCFTGSKKFSSFLVRLVLN